jgi:hypothetical protein
VIERWRNVFACPLHDRVDERTHLWRHELAFGVHDGEALVVADGVLEDHYESAASQLRLDENTGEQSDS